MPKKLTPRGQAMLALLRRAEQGEDFETLAAEADVLPSTLRWWRSQLRRELAESASPFVEVEIKPLPSPRVLDVHVGDISISVPSSFDADHLARIVEALRTC